MAIEKGLVDGHILDGTDALICLKFRNPVDQQKRITVWQQVLDTDGIDR